MQMKKKANSFITGIISLAVSVVILATVFISAVKNTSTTDLGADVCNAAGQGGAGNMSCGMSASEVAMWGLITLVAIVGMVYGVLNVFGLA